MLHRNLLLPCDYLPVTAQPDRPDRNRNLRRRQNQRPQEPQAVELNDDDSGSESDAEDIDLQIYSPDLSGNGLLEPHSEAEQHKQVEDPEMVPEQLTTDADPPLNTTVEEHMTSEPKLETSVTEAVGSEPVYTEDNLDPTNTLEGGEPEEEESGRPQRNRHPPCVFTYSSLGQATMSAVQTSASPAYGWCPPPVYPPGLLYPYQFVYQSPYGPFCHGPQFQQVPYPAMNAALPRGIWCF